MAYESSFIPKGWPPEYVQWVSGVYIYLQGKGQIGVPVYLNAEEEDFSRIAILGSIKETEASHSDFVNTIKETIIIDAKNPRQAFARYASMRFWKASKYPAEPPPFLPALRLSVLAAEQMRSDESFVSSNFYGRLATLIGFSADHKDKVGSSYRKYIAPLWNSFNDWLVQNPALGQPTAYINVSQGYNDFVGVPIGQALLRSSEQEAIETEFFEKFFNSGGSKDVVEIREFYENLDEWMLSSAASNHMRSIYKLAQDVLRVNIWELFERWQPRTRGVGVSGRKAGLKLVLRMGRDLKGRFARFSLNANFDNSTGDAQLAEMKTSERDATVVVVESDQYVGTGTIIRLGDSLSDVLAGNTSITIRNDIENLFSATRQPRAIIPFEVLTPGIWIEAVQMKLGEMYTLLTAAASLEHTMALLQKFGSGATVTSVSELPDQWKLITGFRPTSSIGAPDNLPIHRVNGLHLSLVNGLQLPGGSGIAEFPLTETPEIQVLQVVTRKSPILRIDGPEDWREEYTDFDSPISPSFQVAGEYVVRLFESAKARNPVAHRRFILRDSDSPRYEPAVSDGSLGVRFEANNEISVDFGGSTDQVRALVQGACLVHGELVPFSLNRHAPEVVQQSYDGDIEVWDEDECVVQKSSELAECILNPYARHRHKLLDQVPGLHQRFQRWTCAYCGTSGHIDTRSRKKNQDIKPKVLEKTELPRVDPSLLLERDVEHPPTRRDIIEARIWALGGGSLREAASFSDLHEKNFVTQVLWSLAVSGHIDIAGMETDLCSGEWRTNPLTVVSVNGVLRLVGHRSGEIIKVLTKDFSDNGATLNAKRCRADSADVSDIQVNGCSTANLNEIFANLHGDFKHMVRIDASVAQTFLRALPPLSALRRQLPTHPYMDTFETTEYFELSIAKWLPAVSVNLVGRLVRDTKYGTTYRFVVGGDPTCYQAIRCGYRLGKHLSAHSKRVALVKYDSKKLELAVPLGAELPLLYSRGVVYLTGSMPYRRDNQTVYSNVSETVFEQVKTLLSE